MYSIFITFEGDLYESIIFLISHAPYSPITIKQALHISQDSHRYPRFTNNSHSSRINFLVINNPSYPPIQLYAIILESLFLSMFPSLTFCILFMRYLRSVSNYYCVVGTYGGLNNRITGLFKKALFRKVIFFNKEALICQIYSSQWVQYLVESMHASILISVDRWQTGGFLFQINQWFK